MIHQGQVLTKFSKLEGNGWPWWDISVVMRGRLGCLEEWWVPGVCWVCLPAGHVFTRHRLPLQRPVCNRSFATAFNQCSLQWCISRGKMTLGKLLLQYSLSMRSAYCLVVTAYNWLPGLLDPRLVLQSLACHTAFSLLCFLSTRKSSTKSCETWYS